MSARVGTASGNREVRTLTVGTASGNKAVTEGWVGTASGNTRFYTRFDATHAPSTLYGSRVGSGYVQTDLACAWAVNGSGSYTYTTTRTSGSPEITPTSGTAASTRFQVANAVEGVSYTATFNRTVTDTVTGDTASALVTVTLEAFIGA